MISGYLIIIAAFLLYYLALLIAERKVLQRPAEILEKFLAIMLLYAGVSIIYYALTGKQFLNESPETYSLYLFLIGIITILWAVPNLLSEFSWYETFQKKKKKR
ncbi:MAG: hypothetical protein ACMXYD_03450 [Candidatus Woesearchaeota archaeon]